MKDERKWVSMSSCCPVCRNPGPVGLPLFWSGFVAGCPCTGGKGMRAPHRLIKGFFILLLILGFYLQHNVGLADNGDFDRIMTWFTSGPVGIEPNWPAPDTQDWHRRFFNYWLPYWKLDFPGRADMKSSALLLWLPGVWANYHLVSPHTLYLSNLSLFPKFLLVLYLLLMFYWIDGSGLGEPGKIVLYLTLGIPLLMVFVNTDYVAYFNSFYCETASFIFLFIFLASLIFLKRKNTLPGYFSSITSLLLLSTAKASTFYWPFIAVPFIFSLRGFTRKPLPYIALLIFIIAILCFLSVLVTLPPDYIRLNNYYNSLFYGVLTFSQDPTARLVELGLPDSIKYVGHSAYTTAGKEALSLFENKMSPFNTLQVILREPAIVFRITKYLWDNMQVVSLEYLGKLPPDDPQLPGLKPSLLSLWSQLKINYFPRGYALGLALLLYAAVSYYAIVRTSGICRELGIIGLVTAMGSLVDMYVAILGDGKWEIVKHLFLSNVLFDVSTIASLNIIVAGGIKRILGPPCSRPNANRPGRVSYKRA